MKCMKSEMAARQTAFSEKSARGGSCSRAPETEIASITGAPYSGAGGPAADSAEAANRGNLRFMPLPQVQKNIDGVLCEQDHHIAGSGGAWPSLSRNSVLGHFRIVSKIGAGGMGEVY